MECGIVEGHVRLSSVNAENISFPLLTAITDHLLLYQVSGTEQLSRLFPSLVRIPGRKLFKNYALVLHGNAELESVDISSLKSIDKGVVLIEKNEKLCYANADDWTLIVKQNAKSTIKVSFSKFDFIFLATV